MIWLYRFTVWVLASLVSAAESFAYTSLISATDMSGIQTDVTTVATGLVAVALVVVGAFFVVKAMLR